MAPTVAWLAAGICLSACVGGQKVERRQGEHVEVGRRVPPIAYAWYARARYLHRLGELEPAREAYLAVLAADPESGAAFAGLGSTYCASDSQLAAETFSRGLRRAVEQLPIYVARGRCELGWDRPDLAVTSGRLAFARDPSSPDASALLIDALTESGQTAEASRLERGQRLYARALDPPPSESPSRAAVDLALARGDVALAESLSLELMSKSTLAVRAFALGQHEFAAAQARLVTAAAPHDQEAWTVLALTRGGPVSQGSVGQTGDDGLGPDELLTCLWAEHLRAEAGVVPAELFLDALALGDAASALESWGLSPDPLLRACSARLVRGQPAEVARAATTSARP